jgi:hypothetical protein
VFAGLTEGILSKLNMEPDRRNPDGSALLVVSRVRDVLEIEGGEESRE